jgi:hypothetical protein
MIELKLCASNIVDFALPVYRQVPVYDKTPHTRGHVFGNSLILESINS